MDWEEFKRRVSLLLQGVKDYINLTLTEDCIKYSIDEFNFEYNKEDFEVLLNDIAGFTCNNYAVSSDKSYEVIITNINNKYMDRDTILQFCKIYDTKKHITYCYNQISDKMVYCILMSIKDFDINWLEGFYLSASSKKSELTMLNLLRFAFNSPSSLQIICELPTKIDVLEKYAESFLFNVVYNTSDAFIIAKSVKNIFGPSAAYKKNNNKSDKITPPQLLYKRYLIEQYTLAEYTLDTMLEFISYYHILEYFFEDVYKENIRENLKNILKQPDFYPTNVEDLNKIIKEFGNKGSDCSPGNELDGLKLVLKNYVKINNVVSKLNDYKYNYINYYKGKKVAFSNGSRVDLMSYESLVTEEEKDKVYNKLAKRIYATRNSIVHGKSNELRNNERHIYKHFKDEEALAKEIPLMKAIAEEIIINTAEEI